LRPSDGHIFIALAGVHVPPAAEVGLSMPIGVGASLTCVPQEADRLGPLVRCSAAPCFKRRRFTQVLDLEERLSQEAIRLRQEAEALPLVTETRASVAQSNANRFSCERVAKITWLATAKVKGVMGQMRAEADFADQIARKRDGLAEARALRAPRRIF
jgi:hypothetical protein